MTRTSALIFVLLTLGGCAVVDAGASVVGAAASVAGSAAGAAVDVTGSAVGGAIDLATSDDDGEKAETAERRETEGDNTTDSD